MNHDISVCNGCIGKIAGQLQYCITGFNYEIIYTGTNDVVFTPHELKINLISYEECLEDALQEAVKLIKK